MNRARPVLGLMMALCLVSLTVSAMVARGAMAADGQICAVTGGETVVLAADGLPLIDARGEPVTMDAPLCPDCLVKSVALAAAPASSSLPDRLWVILQPEAIADHRIRMWLMGGQGRGPPVRA